MGKPRLVRVSNCGSFPRWRLASVGSSSKRGEKMRDSSQGGWFGSGTKIAPIAALALGMEVWISSTDEQGTYLVTYEIGEGPGGTEDPRVFRVFHEEADCWREMTEFSPASFINWSKPIGDDPMKEFRVWREYFRNAKDADPVAPYFNDAEEAQPVLDGTTAVYLTKTVEFDAIRKNVNRYFKYLSNDLSLFIFPEIGHIWPKSEPGVTRMFSLGTLALCQRSTAWSTLFDYSFNQKELMSEERTFDNLAKVYQQLSAMMAACPNAELARELLKAMSEGTAELELNCLALIGAKTKIPGKQCWLDAWHALYGPEAVIEMGNWSDHHARISFQRKPIRVASATLRTFLTFCGVQRSVDLIPKANRDSYEIVTPTPEEQTVLNGARAILLQRYPEMRDVPVFVFESRSEEMEKGYLGFCLPPDPPFTDVYIRRDQLASEAKAVGTLNHEYRHIRTGAADGTPELMNCADQDEENMLLDLRRYEQVGWELNWAELEVTIVDPPDDA